ncbi:enoyl-CoA hydratase-related protein [Amycolatopsis sp. Poz14]|uniref:enoyl-CoA hydratase-related protein n=1 Tax=Amycolatopsis sp. Poz14 TaxID=1447705 RepID=UPI001EE8C68D|nr:enoyl-CoA hydratase-related protein [Amycolatopsis sp. Poz14]MCG3751955.1 enoyl-CoA hydratase/isomerase family protein [Amycolatopsis sp. Poz14]
MTPTPAALDETVLAERRGAVLVLTLNRPHRLNAWTQELERRYFTLLDEADADPDVRAVVVTGAGRGFCSGADLTDLQQAGPDSEPPGSAGPRSYPLSFRKPLIAAINGAAAGLGLVEALYCDLRFAVPDAKLTTAFVRRGLIAEYGVAWLLPRLVGRARALDLLLSGRVVRGTEALAMGLVDRIVEPDALVDQAVAYAAELAAVCSPTSMSIIKHQVHRAMDTDFATAFAEADHLMFESFHRPDAREGVSSYLEGRNPEFPPLQAETAR